MNKKEMRAIQHEAERFMTGSKMLGVADVLNSVRVELPLLGLDEKPLYFYVLKRPRPVGFHLYCLQNRSASCRSVARLLLSRRYFEGITCFYPKKLS